MDGGVRLTITVGDKTAVHEGSVGEIAGVLKKSGKEFRGRVRKKFDLPEKPKDK